MAGEISPAPELNGMHGLAEDLLFAAVLGYCEGNPAEVERGVSNLIELSTRHLCASYGYGSRFTEDGLSAHPERQPKASRGLLPALVLRGGLCPGKRDHFQRLFHQLKPFDRTGNNHPF
jgi:hypothetical protein